MIFSFGVTEQMHYSLRLQLLRALLLQILG
jgi:hypothetical protein